MHCKWYFPCYNEDMTPMNVVTLKWSTLIYFTYWLTGHIDIIVLSSPLSTMARFCRLHTSISTLTAEGQSLSIHFFCLFVLLLRQLNFVLQGVLIFMSSTFMIFWIGRKCGLGWMDIGVLSCPVSFFVCLFVFKPVCWLGCVILGRGVRLWCGVCGCGCDSVVVGWVCGCVREFSLKTHVIMVMNCIVVNLFISNLLFL